MTHIAPVTDSSTMPLCVMPLKRRADNGAWEVAIARPGRAPLRKSSLNWTYADARAAEHALLIAPMPMRTLEHALDKWLDEYVPFLRVQAQYHNKAAHMRSLLIGKALLDAAAVALTMRKAWPHLKPSSLNRRLAILRRICHLAYKEWDWIDRPIGTKIQLLPERNERHNYLTRAEVERLRMNCDRPQAGDLIVFAAFTGLRLSEMFRVRARDVRGTSLHLDARTKNGRPRLVPLHACALAIAERMPLKFTPTQLRIDWTLARRRSGLEHIHWHDLRHTFASWLVQNGTSLQVVKELLGHATITVTMRYAHLSDDNLKDAVNQL